MTAAAPVKRGLAVPCFAEDPAWLIELGIAAERAGFDGYFLWDHLVHRPGWQEAIEARLRAAGQAGR